MRRLLTGVAAVFLFFLILQALPHEAAAQTGRLIGTVTDARTGEGIPGVTVAVVNTNQGAITDADGRYVLIGVAPGTYTVRFSYVGYATQLLEGVRISSAGTSSLDVELSEAVLEGEEIFVEAQRPVVDRNQISSIAAVSGEEIARLPVASLQEVIARTSNSYEGFIRGSRRFETRTIVEGIDISDAFYSLQGSAAGAYGGATYFNTNRADQTDASQFSLNPEGVSEVTVNTGAVDPRFASATGGVVAISLAEGRGPLSGSFSARIAPQINRPGPDSLDFYYDADQYLEERDALLSDPDPARRERAALYTWEPGRYDYASDPEMDFKASLGGSITDLWSFQATGQWFQSNGFMPNEFRRRANGQLKTSYNLTDRTKITAVGLIEDRGLWGGWNNRSYHEYWRFYLEGVAQNDGGSYLGSVSVTQVLTSHSYLTGQIYRTGQRTRYGYTDDEGNFLDFRHPQVIQDYIGLPGDRSKMFYHNLSDDYTRSGIRIFPGGDPYKIANPVVYSEDAHSTVNGLRLDYANQLTTNIFVQLGSELKLRHFDYNESYGVDGIGFTLNQERSGDPDFIPEPFIPRDWERNPWELSFYASNRMEYRGLIVNLGLRTDIIDRDTEHFENYFQPFVRDTVTVTNTMANGEQVTRRLARNFANRGESVPLDVFFNPSVGISHPIGERAAMYFSYARNKQLVPYSQLYQMYDGNHSNSQFFNISDPAQDPITSNNYEVGVQWEFVEGWGADINAYMRSIDNYGRVNFTAQTAQSGSNIPPQNTYTTNFGYAEVRGVELVLRRRPLSLARDVTLGMTASYTYSSVEQAYAVSGANQQQFVFDPEDGSTDLPFDNVRQFRHYVQNVRGGSTLSSGYDRTHRVVMRAVSSLPYNFSLGLTGSIESGFQYPRVLGTDPRGRELLTGPTNHQIDLRLENRIDIAGRFGADVFLDVRNITNATNIVAYENFTATGPAHFQETGIPGSRLVLPDGTRLYGEARNIYFGTRVRF